MKKKFSRRHFIKKGAVIATGLTIMPSVLKAGKNNMNGYPVRLGAPVPGKFSDPVEWVKSVRSLRYSAAYCPVQPGAPGELVKSGMDLIPETIPGKHSI
ncbi:MAG: hypothetical protein MUO72_13285 [Bacteroidales bacterium]|nr:hypothetical protein [Bacteroidales bacterium]